MESTDKISVVYQIGSKDPKKKFLAILTVSKSLTFSAFFEQAQTSTNKITFVTIRNPNQVSIVLESNEFNKTLSDCEVVDYAVIKTENSDPHAFPLEKNNSLDLESESARLIAPNHYRMGLGSNLIGRCDNQDCELYRTNVAHKNEFNSWDPFLNELVSCPYCKRITVKPFKLVFFCCKFKLEGTYINKTNGDEDEKDLEGEWITVEEDPFIMDYEKENDEYSRKSFKVSLERL